jgi:NAD(P)-dependent dehydrogenase (short-subunit alcohol dehydrogenase family)
MLLEGKTAVVYGAGGAVGSAVARAFAAAGAGVHLAGRRLGSLKEVEQQIRDAGGRAHAAELDTLDAQAVQEDFDSVVRARGRVDISFNAIGIPQPGIQGIPLIELTPESFEKPIATYTRSHFLTATAAGRRMAEQGHGIILMHTPEPARLGLPLVGGMGPAWAALEALSRQLSAELGPRGVRAVCLRSTGLPETKTIDVVYELHAKALGISRPQFQAAAEAMTHRRRSTSLAELASVAVFLASDGAAAMTGTVANLTGGAIVD